MYLAAIEGGADGVDLAMKPVSGGTSQPDIISFWHALRGTDYDLDIDIQKVIEAEEVFKSCMKDYFFLLQAAFVSSLAFQCIQFRLRSIRELFDPCCRIFRLLTMT